MSGNSRRIPSYVKAASPSGLVRQMYLNNLKYSTQFEYQIVHDGKAWFAWFYLLQDSKEALSNAVSPSNS